MMQPKKIIHNCSAVKVGDIIEWEKKIISEREKKNIRLTGEVIKVKENSVIVRLLDPAFRNLLRIENDLTNVQHKRYSIVSA